MEAINTLELIPKIDNLLLELLRSLSKEDWKKPTIAKLWTVKDVASHLIDTTIRSLSASRDKHFMEPNSEIETYQDLVKYLNQLNIEWTHATKRLSPEILIQLLEIYNAQYYSHLQTLDLKANAIYPVSWAGHETSSNLFHIGREYTEKFLHQQQIREAVGNQKILTQVLYVPFLEVFMMALPYTFQQVNATINTTIAIRICSDQINKIWYLQKAPLGWVFVSKPQFELSSTVKIPADLAWKLFSKSINPDFAIKNISIVGDLNLAKNVLNMVSVMA